MDVSPLLANSKASPASGPVAPSVFSWPMTMWRLLQAPRLRRSSYAVSLRSTSLPPATSSSGEHWTAVLSHPQVAIDLSGVRSAVEMLVRIFFLGTSQSDSRHVHHPTSWVLQASSGVIGHIPASLKTHAAQFYVNVTNTGHADSDDGARMLPVSRTYRASMT